MKKYQIVFITGIIISVIGTKAMAQFRAATPRTDHAENFASDDKTKSKTAASKSTANLNKASSKALRDFKNVFKEEPDVKWFTEPNVIKAQFTKDEIQTSVIYDRKGRWIRTMQFYQENKMPADIRALVKRSIYFDYDITLVQQIREGDITCYIVHLKYDKKCKQVCVYEGEINLLKEFDVE